MKTCETRTDPRAVSQLIDGFAAISETSGDEGITRLGYSPLERRAHDLFAQLMEDAGLNVLADAAGNSIAELSPPGTSCEPAIGTGSHLDSVPHGGRFDGAAGVVAAILAARALARSAEPTRHPLRFIAFANEEGARFGQACNGSRALAGALLADDLDRLHDRDGVTLRSAMEAVGLHPENIGEAQLDPKDWAAFLELHIEQGSVLASRGIQIGVVNTISGSTRTRIVLHGIPSHSGGTPMDDRADALVTAARIAVLARDYARAPEREGLRATIGRLTVTPNAITTIPGRVEMTVDIRDVDPDRQRSASNEIIAAARRIAQEEGVEISVTDIADIAPIQLSHRVAANTIAAAATVGSTTLSMPSGASHDTQLMTRICPTGMIFVPSRNHGISHAPQERSDPADIARGVDVLVAALRGLDQSIDGPEDER